MKNTSFWKKKRYYCANTQASCVYALNDTPFSQDEYEKFNGLCVGHHGDGCNAPLKEGQSIDRRRPLIRISISVLSIAMVIGGIAYWKTNIPASLPLANQSVTTPVANQSSLTNQILFAADIGKSLANDIVQLRAIEEYLTSPKHQPQQMTQADKEDLSNAIQEYSKQAEELRHAIYSQKKKYITAMSYLLPYAETQIQAEIGKEVAQRPDPQEHLFINILARHVSLARQNASDNIIDKLVEELVSLVPSIERGPREAEQKKQT